MFLWQGKKQNKIIYSPPIPSKVHAWGRWINDKEQKSSEEREKKKI